MTWDNDVFELFFKPADDKPGYYEFQVNAAGTVMDMFLPRRGAGGYRRFKKRRRLPHRGQGPAARHAQQLAATRTRAGRSRAASPGRDFLRTGGRPDVGERWKFALCRYDYSVDFEGPELSTCAPLKSQPHPDFHHHRGLRHAALRRPAARRRGQALRHRPTHAADDLDASSARPTRRRPTASQRRLSRT